MQVLCCQARQACGTAAPSAARLPAASTCRLHSPICAGDKKDKKSASDKLAEHKVSADGKHSSKSKAGAAPAKPAPPARPAPRRPPKPEPQVGAGLGTLWAVEHGLLGRVGWPMCQLLFTAALLHRSIAGACLRVVCSRAGRPKSQTAAPGPALFSLLLPTRFFWSWLQGDPNDYLAGLDLPSSESESDEEVERRRTNEEESVQIRHAVSPESCVLAGNRWHGRRWEVG